MACRAVAKCTYLILKLQCVCVLRKSADRRRAKLVEDDAVDSVWSRGVHGKYVTADSRKHHNVQKRTC